ncbi:MAG TPA: aminopeptidase P N-terminal domain-containing protein [Longimicrobium sp.]|nr:aminopeptidase P N-terminal domain-containing protein [Longimicrobium sp.]
MPPISRITRLAACTLAALALPTLLHAQIPRSEYAARREALLAGIDSGVVVAFGAVESVTHWPPFAQLPSFEYLTGFGEPDAALLLVKRGGTGTAQLFVPPRNPRLERFMGARTGPAEALRDAGIPGRLLGGLPAAVDSLVQAGLPLYVVSDVHTADFAPADSLTRGASLVARLTRAHPGLRVASLDAAVQQLRARKTPAEIALLRRAVEISAAGHRQAMRAMAPGCNEGQLQAVLEGVFRGMGAERPGYGSIVGSGPNALKLHYDRNDRVMQAGESVVIDAATALSHYSADITRTLPVSGRFSPEQRAIYQLVLDAQSAFVRQIHAGGSIETANDSGRATIAGGLTRLGLIESPTAEFDPPPYIPCNRDACRQVRLFAWHGYGGHGLGLEVHDPAQYYAAPNHFGPGDVFTVEPGIYVSLDFLDQLPDTPRNRAMLARIRPAAQRYASIGVRIEDDYLVTENGVEWLSRGVPRDIDAVEALMREDPPAGTVCGLPRG